MTEEATPKGSDEHAQRVSLPVWKKALFGAVTVAFLFGALEVTLLLAGVENATQRDDPFVGFSSSVPHFQETDGRVSRPESRATVMNPFEFASQKSAGTTRIFCVGGSTTYGRPFWDETSFAGYLREMLPDATGGAAFEVVNAGGMSYASYRVTGVMREAARFSPDAFVVLTGHNEFLERRTYEAIREMSPFVRETAALLSRTRTGSLLRQLAGAVPRGPQGLGDDVQRVSIDSVGPDAYRRDDAWRDEVLREFRAALGGMVDIAEDAGAAIVFVVPVANARDCPPFKSEASDALAPGNVAKMLSSLDEGRRAVRDGRAAEGIAPLRTATDLDPRYAESWYLLGRALLATGELDEADAAFERALVEDVCALRSSPAIQQAVRDVARERGVPAVEFEALVDQPGGIGVNALADHVHPWPEANALIAEAVVEALREAEAIDTASTWGADAASAATARVDARIDATKHGNELVRLTFVLTSLGKRELAREIAERAATRLGGDGAALMAAAGGLQSGGDVDAALAMAQRAIDREPESAALHARFGIVLKEAKETRRARAEFERALALDADRVEAHAHLAVLDAQDGDLRSAEYHFREVVRLRPDTADSHYNLALVLLRQDRRKEAEEALLDALRIDPAHADARKRLDAITR